jgi:hypothetical protein
MTRLCTTLALFAALLLPCAAARRGAAESGGGRAAAGETLTAGVWGGEHVRMEVGGGGVSFELDCGGGSVGRAIALDGEGRFDVKGTFVAQHAGPVLRDEEANTRPARYTGRVRGQTLTLTVTLAEPEEDAGTFTLKRGSEGRLTKCR